VYQNELIGRLATSELRPDARRGLPIKGSIAPVLRLVFRKLLLLFKDFFCSFMICILKYFGTIKIYYICLNPNILPKNEEFNYYE